MTERPQNVPIDARQAADRLREITDLSNDIRVALTIMRETLGAPNGATPKDVLNTLNDLHAAHLKWLTAEEKFHEKIGDSSDDAAIDFDAIRAEIGGRLDRIRDAFAAGGVLAGLSDSELQALPYLFDFWALPHQLPPGGDWRTWVILGGRGAGKTRAGAEWVRSMVEGPKPHLPGRAMRVGLVGETVDQAREVMVFGDSGILSVCPPGRAPKWLASRSLLVWPNGAEARVYSAHNPETLRGPQFDALWADELAKWPKAQDTWDMLQFGLRLGTDPRACVTTTPRRTAMLRDLLDRSTTTMTHAATQANRANLADSFLAEVEGRYGGTTMGRQELQGELLADIEGALWTVNDLAGTITDNLPAFDRVVVAIDPPGTSHAGSDACGIVVAGVCMTGPVHQWRAVVLEDASIAAARPMAWAQAAVAAYHRHGADRLVAEVNQGGDMVEAVVRQADPLVSYRSVHASKGKVARAEPIAALYEQGRVQHVRGLSTLEDQMTQMAVTGFAGKGSPDRVDALVWALYDLMIEPAKTWLNPSIRGL